MILNYTQFNEEFLPKLFGGKLSKYDIKEKKIGSQRKIFTFDDRKIAEINLDRTKIIDGPWKLTFFFYEEDFPNREEITRGHKSNIENIENQEQQPYSTSKNNYMTEDLAIDALIDIWKMSTDQLDRRFKLR